MESVGVPTDASSLIYLAKADGLRPAVACLGWLIVPPSVWSEVVEIGERRGAREVAVVHVAAESGLVRRVSLDPHQLAGAKRIASEFGLGAGESEVLALAGPHPCVLVDERRATRAAIALNIPTVRTITIPALCARAGVLDETAALVLLDALARHTTFPSRAMARARALIQEALT